MSIAMFPLSTVRSKTLRAKEESSTTKPPEQGALERIGAPEEHSLGDGTDALPVILHQLDQFRGLRNNMSSVFG
jgi:hypothetical protein